MRFYLVYVMVIYRAKELKEPVTLQKQVPNHSLSIVLTGGSSFTGAGLASELAKQGYHVKACLSQSMNSYAGYQAERIRRLPKTVQILDSLRSEQNHLSDLAKTLPPSAWIWHHHWMQNYQSPNYDWALFEKTCLYPLASWVHSLPIGSQIIYSGTFFEPDEGGHTPN